MEYTQGRHAPPFGAVIERGQPPIISTGNKMLLSAPKLLLAVEVLESLALCTILPSPNFSTRALLSLWNAQFHPCPFYIFEHQCRDQPP